MGTGEFAMKEKAFIMKLGKSVAQLQDKGFRVEMKKARNDKGMSLNKIFFYGKDKGLDE